MAAKNFRRMLTVSMNIFCLRQPTEQITKLKKLVAEGVIVDGDNVTTDESI